MPRCGAFYFTVKSVARRSFNPNSSDRKNPILVNAEILRGAEALTQHDHQDSVGDRFDYEAECLASRHVCISDEEHRPEAHYGDFQFVDFT